MMPIGKSPIGFVLHHRVRGSANTGDARWQAAGPMCSRRFRDEYIQKLRDYPKAHVVMLIDFDGHVDQRRAEFENEIPDEIKPRVFVVGSKHTPETLKNALNKSFERNRRISGR